MDRRFRGLVFAVGVCTVTSCGKVSVSNLQTEKSGEEKEALLRQLKLEILQRKEFAATLETAFAVHSLEQELNRKFTIETVDGQKELKKYFVSKEKDANDEDRLFKTSLAYFALPAFLAYESLDVTVKSIGRTEKGKTVLPSSAERFRSGFSSLMLAGGLTLGSSSVLSFRTFAVEKPYLLTEKDRAELRSQITSKEFLESIAEVAKFLQLQNEEARELSSTFVKEVVRVYDRTELSALTEVAAYDFFVSLNKEINFFKIARKFKPNNNPEAYSDRITFLEMVVLGFIELHESASGVQLKPADGIQLRLSLFRSYRETLSTIEKDSHSHRAKEFERCRGLLDARLALLEEILALSEKK